MKDVPTDLAAGTTLAAVLERADARDVLVTMQGLALGALPAGAVIGTTSLRRQAQTLASVPSASIRLLRGNVETRLRKAARGPLRCDVPCRRGPCSSRHRAGRSGYGRRRRARSVHVRAGAGAGRPRDHRAQRRRARRSRRCGELDHAASRISALAERGFARVFGGGCHLPLAAYAERKGNELALVGLLVAPDGSRRIRDEVRVTLGDAASAVEDGHVREQLGASLGAFVLRARGAARSLADGAAPRRRPGGTTREPAGRPRATSSARGPAIRACSRCAAATCSPAPTSCSTTRSPSDRACSSMHRRRPRRCSSASGTAATASPRNEIEALLVARAREGKTVVRLKGGDPFIFGRGGEEAEACRRAGIAFEVVPGVTSAIAVPAYAGIPLTHREHSSLVTFVTGQAGTARAGYDIDWDGARAHRRHAGVPDGDDAHRRDRDAG